MEKPGTPKNRLTRSTAKHTPSKKSGDSSDINPADELKNLKKSRRKNDPNLKNNGDNNSGDLESKKQKNCEEISDCNSVDSEDSNTSLKKNTPKSKNQKSSPSISRRSLRPRRSVTPGPEMETNTRRMTRSVSEEKLNLANTPTKRNTRAKSESKDFVFTPSKQHNVNESNHSHLEMNNKCMPINSLKVIDEIVEEDGLFESHNSPQKPHTELANLKDEAKEESFSLLVNKNNENKDVCVENGKTDENSSGESNNLEGTCQIQITQIASLKDSSKPIDGSEQLVTEEGESVSEEVVNTHLESRNQLPDVKETDYGNAPTNQSSTHILTCVDAKHSKTSKNLLREKETSEETRFYLSISESTKIRRSSGKVVKGGLPLNNKQVANSSEETVNIFNVQGDVQNTNNFEETNDVLSNSENLVQNNQNITLGNELHSKSPSNSIDNVKESQELLAQNNQNIILGNELHSKSPSNSIDNVKESQELLVQNNQNIILGNELHLKSPNNSIDNVKESQELPAQNNQNIILGNELHSKSPNNSINNKKESPELPVQNNQNITLSHELHSKSPNNSIDNVKESQEVPLIQISVDENTKHLNDCNKTIETHLENVKSSENISISENNNVSSQAESLSDNENVEAPLYQESTTAENTNYDTTNSFQHKTTPSNNRSPEFDKNADDSVVICGSDSEEASGEVEENHHFAENIRVDSEDKSEISSYDCRPVTDNTYISCENGGTLDVSIIDESVGDSDIGENYSSEKVNSGPTITEVQDEASLDNSKKLIDESSATKAGDVEIVIIKNSSMTLESEQTKNTETATTPPKSIKISSQTLLKARTLAELIAEDEVQKRLNKNDGSTISLGTKSNSFQTKENSEQDPFEEETSILGSEPDSDLYKDMSDFGSDMEGKKGDSRYGGSVSSDKTGDTEASESSSEEGDDVLEGGVEEDAINEDELSVNENKNVGNIQDDNQDDENDLDDNKTLTYDQALAILNKDRVNKIDDEEFFDMFTQELNRVSEESGSDSDIAIVDEYIAEPEEEQQQKKPNQKSGNPQPNLKNRQQPTPSHFKPNRSNSVAYQQVPTQHRISLRPPQKSVLPPPSIPQNFAGPYDEQNVPYNEQNAPYNEQNAPYNEQHAPYNEQTAAYEHSASDYSQQNMARMNYPQGEVYQQYNTTQYNAMDPNRGHMLYNQFAPPNMHDPRMLPPHPVVMPPYGPVHYSVRSSLKLRNVDTMCGPQSSNQMHSNTIRSTNDEDGSNMKTGISTATMTETDDQQEQGATFNASSNKTGSVTNPILEMFGLDKKRLRMLKKALGLDESRTRRRNLIKQILIEEAQKMGFGLNTSSNIKKHSQRQQRNSDEFSTRIKGRKKPLVKLETESDSSGNDQLSECSPVFSNVESDTKSEERFNASEDMNRKINLKEDSVSVTFDTRQEKKNKHRPSTDSPVAFRNKSRHRAQTSTLKTTHTNKRKPSYQYSELSDEENIKQSKKRRQYKGLRNTDSFVKKSQRKRKMTQGKRQNNKSTVLKSKCGLFTVDPATATTSYNPYQSETDGTSSQDESAKYLEEMKKSVKKQAAGKNKLSNMFGQYSLREPKKGLKRKSDEAFELSEQETKSKRLPADILNKLEKKVKKPRRQRDDPSGDSLSEEELATFSRKPRKRSNTKKLKIPSAALDNTYVPLVVPGPIQFGLQRLDREENLSSAEKAAKFRSDRLYGSAVKRITIMDFED